jgi:hypothetical protein
VLAVQAPASIPQAVSAATPQAQGSRAAPHQRGRSEAETADASPALAPDGVLAMDAARTKARHAAAPPPDATGGELHDGVLRYPHLRKALQRASERDDSLFRRGSSIGDRGSIAAVRADEQARWMATSEGKVRTHSQYSAAAMVRLSGRHE